MADTVGNKLGPRGYFEYETEDGQTYAIQQDCSLAQAVGNTETAANLPRLLTSSKRPYKPRSILVEDADGSRKEIVIGDPASPFMTANAATQFQINNVVYTVTARKGEQAFFPKIGACPVPEPPPAG